MTKHEDAPAAGARRWDRLLWGVLFTGAMADDPPMIIGGPWHDESRHFGFYPGEPMRALLFCNRAEARSWCADTMRKWRSDCRQPDDVVARWKVRPVRVRETVQVEAPNAKVSGCRRQSVRAPS